MAHSYEEIRSAALDILAGRQSPRYHPSQYEHLRISVAEVFAKRDNEQYNPSGEDPQLDSIDNDLFLEVFWDFFRQGIITLGFNNLNREFPFFKVTATGRKIMDNQSGYFFHNVSSYEQLIILNVPAINKVTMFYLKEAMQAFQSGCILSATVMLGVAAEHTLELLLEKINQNSAWKQVFSLALKERTILHRFNQFRKILQNNLGKIPSELKEDLDTQFAGIQSIIRTSRNESGHPTGQIIDREQVFVLLQLFIPYCKKIYSLIDFF